jgi:hypothetical protein
MTADGRLAPVRAVGLGRPDAVVDVQDAALRTHQHHRDRGLGLEISQASDLGVGVPEYGLEAGDEGALILEHLESHIRPGEARSLVWEVHRDRLGVARLLDVAVVLRPRARGHELAAE